MRLAERDMTAGAIAPAWAVGFLRDRCSVLQRQLVNPGDPLLAAEAEEDSIHCWMELLGSLRPLPETQYATLEALHLLHARIAQRLERGGVGDISEDVEYLVRAVLIDQLQRQTDDVVDILA